MTQRNDDRLVIQSRINAGPGLAVGNEPTERSDDRLAIHQSRISSALANRNEPTRADHNTLHQSRFNSGPVSAVRDELTQRNDAGQVERNSMAMTLARADQNVM